MILLDTDHINVLKYPEHPRFASLTTQLNMSADQDIATTVITLEEQMRGWLAWMSRAQDVRRQVPAYTWQGLRAQRIRIGTMDLKIAAIALVHDALLLSANLRDFQQVPNLRVANWIH